MIETEKVSPIQEKESVKTEVMMDIKSREKPEVRKEVESWLEKLEEDPKMTQQKITDDSGQTVLKPSVPINPKITLPVQKTTFLYGFKKGVDEAGRWLSEFVFRLIKINKGNVKFKEE